MQHLDYALNGNQGVGQFGQYGLRVLTSNAIAGETFIAIQVITDCVISSKLDSYQTNNIEIIGDSVITNLALEAGTVIYGRFYDLEVASGKVIAYKG
jgi:hypothetical protein